MPRLAALVTGCLALLAATLAPVPARADTGSLTAADGVLFAGCHRYPYAYTVSPASSPWYLETFLYGPDGSRLAAGLFISDGDPTSGDATFGLCGRATTRGTFRIEGRLTSGSETQTIQTLAPTTFTLGRPGSASALTVSDARPRRWDRLVFVLASTRQAPDGMVPADLATVVLQRRTPTGWRRVGGGLAETNAQGLARVRITWRGGRERFRMVTRGDSEEYAASRSAALTVRTRS